MKFSIKKLTALLLAAMMICCSLAAGVYADEAAPDTVGTVVTDAAEGAEEAADVTAEASSADLVEQLRSLDGVITVTPVEVSEENKAADRFQGRYVVVFEQPINWDNPEEGTFPQRVLVGYSETADVTCYNTSGYCLTDKLAPGALETADVRDDLKNRYDCNFVDLEYRFFGDSVPEGLSLDDTKYWEYMTSENASKDFHHIVTELNKVLGGSTIFCGGSKGGYTTESMAYYFPDDIDAYISYVAPLCDGTADPRLYENVSRTIGSKDPAYGEEGSAKLRDLVTSMQLMLLDTRARDMVQAMFMSQVEAAGLHISPLVTEDEAYEEAVVEFGVTIWQSYPHFEEFEAIMALPEETEEEFFNKVISIGNYFIGLSAVGNVTYDYAIAPYYIQSYTEMGNLRTDFTYLREAGAELRTPPENEADLLVRLWAPLVVNNGIEYDGTYREELINFMNTTDKDIIKIVALSDPWYAVKAPETDNEHIHLYEVTGCHITDINLMDEEAKAECWALIDSLLGK
ncbi:MAG: hypothetical protein HUJ76_03965 [Parasporobacterium sp.]|nr:hypothetical protein [Parasporobacterium sp.]